MLYIMRHGRTDWNERHKLQGRTDIPLNEDGRRMAEAAREEYLDVPLDICYCSPLIRAKETAEIVLRGRDIRIRTDERLREMSFGEYEGIENSFSFPDCPVNFITNPALDEFARIPEYKVCAVSISALKHGGKHRTL